MRFRGVASKHEESCKLCECGEHIDAWTAPTHVQECRIREIATPCGKRVRVNLLAGHVKDEVDGCVTCLALLFRGARAEDLQTQIEWSALKRDMANHIATIE